MDSDSDSFSSSSSSCTCSYTSTSSEERKIQLRRRRAIIAKLEADAVLFGGNKTPIMKVTLKKKKPAGNWVYDGFGYDMIKKRYEYFWIKK